MTTNAKLTIDFAVEHVIALKGNTVEPKKINKVRKYKKGLTLCETLGYIRATVTACGKDTNEFSSVRHTFLWGEEEGQNIQHKKRVNRVVKRGENLCNG